MALVNSSHRILGNSGSSGKKGAKRSQNVLVDYDGVVLRSSTAGRLVNRRCAEFTQKVLGLSDVDKGAVVNAGLYKHYGHTVIGLRSLGIDISVKEFNKAVYGGLQYESMGLGEHDFDLAGLEKLYKLYPNTLIFSSAPDEWIIGTLGACSTGRKLLDRVKIARTQDPEILKPDVNAFFGLLGLSELTPDVTTLIDDNLMNVQSAARIENWRCLWLNMHAFRLTDKITSVRNLDEAIFALSLHGTLKHDS